MTKNDALKTAVRARMERTGQPFTEARRWVEDGQPATRWDRGVLPAAGYTVQMDRDRRGVLPYPAFVTASGYMFNSLFDHGLILGFEEAGSPVRSIALDWREFLADPQQAVGMVPVTKDPFTDQWSSWVTPITSLTQMVTAPVHPEERAARLEEFLSRRYLDGYAFLSLDYGEEFEVRDTGQVRSDGDPSREGGVGEFVREDGTVIGWGTFLNDPQSVVGTRVRLWDTEGRMRILGDERAVVEQVFVTA